MIGQVVIVDDVATAFADLVVLERPRTMALSGGGTARRCYEALAARSAVDWPSVAVLFGDERDVPVEHPDSNEGMAREELLDHVPVGAVHSLREAAAYDALVRSLGAIDLIHLGLGPDGHTASLFPGSPALEVDDRYVVDTGDDDHPHRRRTFTFAAVALGGHVVITVDGEEKRDAWARVTADDPTAPASRIRPAPDGRVTWLVARSLSRSTS